jgi:flagellin-specific chaperone FliS
MTNIPKQLGKIESQLQAFAMTENVENLQKARYLISELESKLQRQKDHEFAKRFSQKLQSAFKNYIEK